MANYLTMPSEIRQRILRFAALSPSPAAVAVGARARGPERADASSLPVSAPSSSSPPSTDTTTTTSPAAAAAAAAPPAAPQWVLSASPTPLVFTRRKRFVPVVDRLIKLHNLQLLADVDELARQLRVEIGGSGAENVNPGPDEEEDEGQRKLVEEREKLGAVEKAVRAHWNVLRSRDEFGGVFVACGPGNFEGEGNEIGKRRKRAPEDELNLEKMTKKLRKEAKPPRKIARPKKAKGRRN